MKRILLFCFLLLPCAAMAALPPAALRDVRLELPIGARLPLDLTAKDISGQSLTIRTALAGQRGFVVFADYTCKNLCGPALVLLGTALAQSGLSPTQYRLIVIGLDPKDTADDARRMAAAQLPEAVRAQAELLLPDARNITTLTKALGFRYAYDAAIDQFAHPEVVYSVKPDGHVVRVLSPLTMSPADISHAFSDPPQSPGTLYDRFRVLCYRFGQISGAYTPTVELLLKISSVLTLAAMAGGLILMRKRRDFSMTPGALFVEAATNAQAVDTDFLILTIISTIIFVLVFALVLIFAIRYRRGSAAPRGPLPSWLKREAEIGWTAATVFLALFIFWWGVAAPAALPGTLTNPLEIHVYAKQWMWKVEHPNGAREINTLHLPLNTPVRLLMTAQDVIHSFYVPAFRIKHDVLPDRISVLEVFPTKTGDFHLFCAEYCGAEHSNMTGVVTVMVPEEYARWRDSQPHSDSIAAEGEALFHSLGCSGCHDPASSIHAPDLRGLFGHSVPLEGGRVAVVDEAYLRDCILVPQKNIPAGYPPIMPSFSNVVDDSQIERLIAYIKSLSLQEPAR